MGKAVRQRTVLIFALLLEAGALLAAAPAQNPGGSATATARGADVAGAAGAAGVAAQARGWRVRHEREMIAEFSEVLALPNLASDGPNIARNATAIQTMMERRGLCTRLLTLEGAPPIVVGETRAPEGAGGAREASSRAARCLPRVDGTHIHS